jgi:pimeloyl-ACP methyl ester carboxylesterase
MKTPSLIAGLMVCCSLSSESAPKPSTTMDATSAIERDVDIGGRTLHLATYGHGSPAVIVEAGLGEPAVESATWSSVITNVAKTSTVCVYDRAGLGKSSAVTNGVRTTRNIVDDLHALLIKADIRPPYILVGHSLGCFAVRLYAGRYPQEIAGVVLVDSSYPDQWPKLLAALPPESSSEPKSLKNARTFFAGRETDPNNNPEHLDLAVSSREVGMVTNLGNMPLIVLSHSHGWSIDPNLPKDVSDKIEQQWEQWQNELCQLSTQSSHQTALKAGHYIQQDEPQLVIDAILKLESTAKSKTR